MSIISTDIETEDFIFSGPIVELITTLAAENGKSVEFAALRWDRLKDHFVSDKCDFLAPIFPTIRRSEFGVIAAPMYSVGLGAVCKKNNVGILNPADLRRKSVKIGVMQGEVGWEYISDEFPSKINSANVLISTSCDITDIMYAVIDDRIDIAIADSISCRRFILQNDPASIRLHDPFVIQPLQTYSVGLMVRKEDKAFAEWLDSEVRKVRTRGEYLQNEAHALDGWGRYILRLNIPENVDLPRIT